jgi:hypothetical protein
MRGWLNRPACNDRFGPIAESKLEVIATGAIWALHRQPMVDHFPMIRIEAARTRAPKPELAVENCTDDGASGPNRVVFILGTRPSGGRLHSRRGLHPLRDT